MRGGFFLRWRRWLIVETVVIKVPDGQGGGLAVVVSELGFWLGEGMGEGGERRGG